jgi:acetylornithine aminotransferase
VADIIRDENLVANTAAVGDYLKRNIPSSPLIKEVRGRGLMLGIEFTQPVAELRKQLLFDKHIFTGVAGTQMVRLLAPLTLSESEAAEFIAALTELLAVK